jgi:hypothetical protein
VREGEPRQAPANAGSEGSYLIVSITSWCAKEDFAIDLHGTSISRNTGASISGVRFVGVDTLRRPTDYEELFSKAIGVGKPVEDALVALCAALRPATKSLRILKKDDAFILHTVDEDGAIPLYLAGDGLRRLFRIACHLAEARDGVVLIEEPECFQHPKAMDDFTRLLWAAVGQGTQVVFSTHSLELLANVFAAEEGRDLSKACILRTRLDDGKLHTGIIDGAEARERLHDVGEDLRR